MSISMMYQFENKLFSLPAKFFDFLVLPPPPLIKYLLCTYGNILNKEKVNFH